MEDTRRNIMVGAFVLCGLAALVVLVMMFGYQPRAFYRGNTYEVNLNFDSVAGIRAGTLVTAHGKSIGHVRSVEFVDPTVLSSGVQVVVAIETKYRLPDDSTATTVEAGLIGGGRPPIEIHPGTSETMLVDGGSLLKKGEIINAATSLFPKEIMDTFFDTTNEIRGAAEKLQPVLVDLHGMLEQRDPSQVDAPGGPAGNIASAAARLDALIKSLSLVLGDPEVQNQFRVAMANISTMSEDGKELTAELRTVTKHADDAAVRLTGTLENLDTQVNGVARDVHARLDQADRLLANLNDMAQAAAHGDGTIAKLLNDDRLYESAVLTVRRLADIAEELRLIAIEWKEQGFKLRF